MERDLFRRVESEFHRIAALDGQAEAEALAALASEDPELANEVERLLAADASESNLRTSDGRRLAEDLGSSVGLAPGHCIGPYRLTRLLGSGGMGEVFAAEQTEPVRREVAIKVILRNADSGTVVSRFQAERQALAMMDHPNIARIYDAGVTDSGLPYFAMDLVTGAPIDSYCDQHRLSIDERLRLIAAVCDAVQHAHVRGVIHRDLKPSNLLVSTVDGRPFPTIIDFGIAKATGGVSLGADKLTLHGASLGTPQYMSPEQAGADPESVDIRSDVFSLGIVLYELLTGQLPFASELGPDEVRRQVREQDPSRPSRQVTTSAETLLHAAHQRSTEPALLLRRLRSDLDWITLKALEKNPDERYETVRDLADDLRRHLGHRPVAARAPSLSYRLRKFSRRHRAAVATAGVILVLLASLVAVSVGAAIVSRRQAKRVASERDRAEQVTAFLVDLFEVADPERAQGREISARELLDRGAARLDRDINDQPLTRATMSLALGRVYRSLGEPERATRHLQEALRIYRSQPDATVEVAETLHELGVSHADQSNWTEAERLLAEAARRREEWFGADDPRLADTLHALGRVLIGSAGYQRAQLALERAVAIQRRSLQGQDPRIAATLLDLGLTAHYLGQYERMETHFQQAIEIYRQNPGEPSSKYGDALQMLVGIAAKRGDFERSERYLMEGIGVVERLYGPDHERAARILTAGVDLELLRGDLEAAETRARRVLAIADALPEPQPSLVAETLRTLTSILNQQGRLEDAETVGRQAVALSRTAEAPVRVAQGLVALGDVLRQRGRFEQARMAYDEVLAGFDDQIPPAVLAVTHASYAELARLQQQAGQVEAHLRQAVDLYQRVATSGSLRLATMRFDLARALNDRGRADEARDLLEHAVPVLEAKHGAGHPQVRQAKILLRATQEPTP